MAYLSEKQLQAMGFKSLGEQVKISEKASIYDCENISIGDFSRIDDFCILSGNLEIGRFCHITPMCLLAAGTPGIKINDFSTLAYGVKIFAQSDDYSGESLVNSLIPKKFKKEIYSRVEVERHVIIGAGSVIMPGASLGEGCSVGAMSLVTKPTNPWGIYFGVPARRVKERKKDLLALEKIFMKERNDSI